MTALSCLSHFCPYKLSLSCLLLEANAYKLKRYEVILALGLLIQTEATHVTVNMLRGWISRKGERNASTHSLDALAEPQNCTTSL